MLVLSRKVQQQIQIGNNIVITILEVKGHTVRVGIEAPKQVTIMRSEVAKDDSADASKSKPAGRKAQRRNPPADTPNVAVFSSPAETVQPKPTVNNLAFTPIRRPGAAPRMRSIERLRPNVAGSLVGQGR